MKTQFKHHIKFGSCWYDQFFKIDRRIQKSKHKSVKEQQEKNTSGSFK